MDSRREAFRLSKAYENKIDVINIVTAPEIEMLVIFHENKYAEYKKSKLKPSDFCLQKLHLSRVKEYNFIKSYFSIASNLVEAIGSYQRISKIPKGELSLYDLLK